VTTHQSFLVLHGIGNHRPPEHWQFWISARLAADGHQVLYPSLPEPDAPSLQAWATTVHEQLGVMRNPRRTVLCHSLSCLLWLSIAAEISPGSRPSRLLLVAPPAPDRVPAAGVDLIRGFATADVTSSVTDELRVVCSDDDPYHPGGAAETYGKLLSCPVDVIPGAGHINPDSGYGPWRSLEMWCRQPARPLTRIGK
jgi:predicted alpha/beta hydrolase family esterase